MTGQLRILLTGFSEFPGVPDNPSEALIASLAGTLDEIAPGAIVETAILVVEYGRGLTAMRDLCERIDPDIVISFGVDARARGLRVEQIARNSARLDRADVSGQYPASEFIRQDGPGEFASRLPVTRLEDVLTKAGLPVEPSQSAGDYLCNAVFYDTLHSGLVKPDRWSGFIHIPMPADDGMSAEDIERGARLIIQTCFTAFRDQAANA